MGAAADPATADPEALEVCSDRYAIFCSMSLVLARISFSYSIAG